MQKFREGQAEKWTGINGTRFLLLSWPPHPSHPYTPIEKSSAPCWIRLAHAEFRTRDTLVPLRNFAMDCVICCEKITNIKRKIVECPSCKKGACVQCTKSYILSNETDPKCMHCGDEWDPLFMCDHFPKSWISKEYTEHRGNVLINRDKPRKIEIYRRMMEERQNRTKIKTQNPLRISLPIKRV